MREAYFHTKAAHQTDYALRHREGLAVRRGIRPRHGDFFAFKVFNTAKVMDNVQHVGH